MIDAVKAYAAKVFQHTNVGGEGDPKIPKPDWPNNRPPGSGDSKAEADAIKSAEEAINELLAKANQGVEESVIKLDEAKTKLEAFKAALPTGKATTNSQAVQEQVLIGNEMAAQVDHQTALLAQRRALLAAAAAEDAMAKQVSASDKDRISHMDELKNKATDHRIEAEKLLATYHGLDVTIMQLAKELKVPFEEVAAAIEKAAKAAEDLTEAGAKAIYAGGASAIAGQQEALRYDQGSDAAKGKPQTTAKNDAFEVARAALAQQLAQLAVNLAQANAVAAETYAKAVAGTEKEAAAQAKVVEADGALVAAQNKLIGTTNDLAIAQQKQAHDTLTASNQIQAFGQDLLSKLESKIPGLSTALDAFKSTLDTTGNMMDALATGGLSILIAMFEQAVSETMTFKDIMGFVNNIVKEFATIIDRLRPVIDALLHAIIFLINVIIVVWNDFLRFVSVIGWFIGQIPLISQNFNNLNDALIQITNTLPTLNQLAAGAHPQLGGTTSIGSVAGVANSHANGNRVGTSSSSGGGGGGDSGGSPITVNVSVGTMTGDQAGAEALGQTIADAIEQQSGSGNYNVNRVGSNV
jgi:hypothetical protein